MSLINRKTPTQATKETGNIGNKRNVTIYTVEGSLPRRFLNVPTCRFCYKSQKKCS
jgi:hypothetical protein